MLNNIIRKKMITGEVDKELLLKRLINFNLLYIIPILYDNSQEKAFDSIANREAKLDILNNSI